MPSLSPFTLHESSCLNIPSSHRKRLTLPLLQFAVMLGICLGGSLIAEAQLFKAWGRSSGSAKSIPTAFNATPTQGQLLQHLARSTAAVKQVDASISVSMAGAPKLKGTLQIERPLRLRLKAGVLGVDQMGVDVGSNNDLFWIWTRVPIPGQAPTLMFAYHEQFKRSSGALRQAIPLEPSWLINALGLVEFSPNDFHEGPTTTPQGRLRLVTVSNAPAGRQYRITIIDPQSGLIEQQSIYDEKRNLVAYTNSTRYQFYPQHSVSLPNKIEMHLFTEGQEQKLTLTTAQFNINSLFGDPNRMWAMPQPANVQRIDLSLIGGSSTTSTPPARTLPPIVQPASTRLTGPPRQAAPRFPQADQQADQQAPRRPLISSPPTFHSRTRLGPLK